MQYLPCLDPFIVQVHAGLIEELLAHQHEVSEM